MWKNAEYLELLQAFHKPDGEILFKVIPWSQGKQLPLSNNILRQPRLTFHHNPETKVVIARNPSQMSTHPLISSVSGDIILDFETGRQKLMKRKCGSAKDTSISKESSLATSMPGSICHLSLTPVHTSNHRSNTPVKNTVSTTPSAPSSLAHSSPALSLSLTSPPTLPSCGRDNTMSHSLPLPLYASTSQPREYTNLSSSFSNGRSGHSIPRQPVDYTEEQLILSTPVQQCTQQQNPALSSSYNSGTQLSLASPRREMHTQVSSLTSSHTHSHYSQLDRLSPTQQLAHSLFSTEDPVHSHGLTRLTSPQYYSTASSQPRFDDYHLAVLTTPTPIQSQSYHYMAGPQVDHVEQPPSSGYHPVHHSPYDLLNH